MVSAFRRLSRRPPQMTFSTMSMQEKMQQRVILHNLVYVTNIDPTLTAEQLKSAAFFG